MPATPNITLTATLEDLSGNPAGSVANPSRLLIALCNFGPALPQIIGTTMIARVGPYEVPSTGGLISVLLWGNDQISPANTYYSITVLDGFGNVVQTGAYIFTGGPLTIDLSNATQIVDPYGFILSSLTYQPCTGAVPGTAYVAPGQVVMVFYNGIALRPTIDYTVAGGNNITLTFSTQTGDTVDSLCIV